MSDMESILVAANSYAAGLKKVEERRANWIKKSVEVKDYLSKVANMLNEQAEYKPGYYVDTYYPYDEEIQGHCFHLPSIGFRSGNMPLGIAFKNDTGSIKVYSEKGFEIVINPAITGQLVITLYPHDNEFGKKEIQALNLLMIDDPDELTNERLDDIITNSIEMAYHTSYTGMADQNNGIKAHSPIGFKRYETTEPVKENEDGIK